MAIIGVAGQGGEGRGKGPELSSAGAKDTCKIDVNPMIYNYSGPRPPDNSDTASYATDFELSNCVLSFIVILIVLCLVHAQPTRIRLTNVICIQYSSRCQFSGEK